MVSTEWMRPLSLSMPDTYRYAGLRLHPEVPLVAFLGLVHLRIPVHWSCSFASGALGLCPRRGGTGSGDQSGIDNRALLHGHAVGLEMGFDHLKNLLAEIVLLQQMAKGQDRGLIRDPIAGSLRSYHCWSRWMGSMVSSG